MILLLAENSRLTLVPGTLIALSYVYTSTNYNNMHTHVINNEWLRNNVLRALKTF